MVVGAVGDDRRVSPFPIRRAEPELAVPPGRLGYVLNADRLLLHTVQTADAFETLLTEGTLRPDPALAERDYGDAYDWMYRQMAARLPTSGPGALWLWARIRREELVSDCRRAKGQVLLTCRIPRERVLLSHFMEWHIVLNRGLGIRYLPGESDAVTFARWERMSGDFRARLKAAGAQDGPIRDWPAELRAEIEQSWECILDQENYGRFECWQATVHALHVDDVIEAVLIE